MKPKRLNPYQRLLEIGKQWRRDIQHAETRTMFVIDDFESAYDMAAMFERTQAGQQLGYKVVLTAKDGKLFFDYVKEVPTPWEFK